MRFYLIEVLNPDGSPFLKDKKPLAWTSFVGGRTDLGAPQIELDIPVTTQAIPIGAAAVTVWGVPFALVKQATDLNGLNLRVTGGFKPGLPLATLAANSGQAGVLLHGTIQQAYGNWIGNQIWLRFIVTADGVQINQTPNITVNWAKGTLLADAVSQTLKTAFPGKAILVAIDSRLVLGETQPSAYPDLSTFARYLRTASLSLITDPTYLGVDIFVGPNSITVADGTAPPPKVQDIAFTDLIGQPVWIDQGTVQVVTMMRADVQPFQTIQLPPTQVTVAPGNPLVGPPKGSGFTGRYFVKNGRHVGNFRAPDALAWVTAFDCSPAA